MNTCYLCLKESRESVLGYYCCKCKRIKDLLNLYGESVYEVLDLVLVRSPDQQQKKIDIIETKKVNDLHKKVFGEVTRQTAS